MRGVATHGGNTDSERADNGYLGTCSYTHEPAIGHVFTWVRC
jgi:hypothetical protein